MFIKKIIPLLCLAAVSVSGWEVKVSPSASDADKNAALDLQHYLKLTAKTLKLSGREAVFLVGDKTAAAKAGILAEKLQEEEWRIANLDNQIILIGGGMRGTSYAVYHFIEDYLNIRWWNSLEEDVPPARNLNFSSVGASGKPFFWYREIYWTDYPYVDGKFHVRNRLNGWAGIYRRFGGSVHFGPPSLVHTLAHYVPTAKYMKTHPEYFALVNGKRDGSVWKGQLCLTNESVYQLVEKQLMQYLDQRKRPSGNSPAVIYSLSQHDNKNNFCQCEKCLAAVKGKNQTDLLLGFINRLARKVMKVHPDVFIETLAYHYTEILPKEERPEKNVIIRLCDTKSNPFYSPYDAANRYIRELLPKWSKICTNLLIWDYAITYDESAGLPVCSEYTYPEVHRFYADNHVRGIFWEHEDPSGADFFPLKFYLEIKYLENPYRKDFETLRQDFMTRYYGPGAAGLTEYRELLRDEVAKKHPAMKGSSIKVEEFKFISLDTALKMLASVERAEKAVENNPVLLRRVQAAGNGINLLLGVALEGYYRKEWEKLHPGEKYPVDIHLLRRKIGNNWLQNKNFVRKPPQLPDFMKGLRTVEFNSGFSTAGRWARQIRDKDGLNGYTMCIFADEEPANLKLPEVFGFWERYPRTATKRMISGEELKKLGPGYHWYKCGNIQAKDLRDIRVYVSRQWVLQKNLPSVLPLVWSGKKMDLWLHLKYQGPMFYENSSEPNRICFDRMIFTEAGKIPADHVK